MLPFADLPFVEPPAPRQTRRIGNATTGVLELEVRGGLTVNESGTISDLLAEGDSTLVQGAKLADAIATEEGISITEAYQIIENTVAGNTLEPEAQAIMLRHSERIQRIVDTFRLSGRESAAATVTSLIRWRCNRPNWTMEQTRALDGPLFDGILQLAQDEQAAEKSQSAPLTESDLKKQPPATRRSKRTGAPSSGN